MFGFLRGKYVRRTLPQTTPTMNLSDDATFFLLRLVEQFPALWDMTLAEYADTTVKESIWERIAKEMNEEWPAYGPYDASKYHLYLLSMFCVIIWVGFVIITFWNVPVMHDVGHIGVYK